MSQHTYPRCIIHGPYTGSLCEVCNQMELDTLRKQLALTRERLEKARGLLMVAKCPACDGSGAIGHEAGGCDMDGENDTREVVWEQCQWCDERTAAQEGK